MIGYGCQSIAIGCYEEDGDDGKASSGDEAQNQRIGGYGEKEPGKCPQPGYADDQLWEAEAFQQRTGQHRAYYTTNATARENEANDRGRSLLALRDDDENQ